MKRNIPQYIVISIAVIAMAGCGIFKRQPIVATNNEQTDKLIAEYKETVATLTSRIEEGRKLDAAAAGSVYGATVAVEGTSEGANKQATKAELALAYQALGEATSEAKVDAERRVNAILSGQVEEIKARYGDAAAHLTELNATISVKDKAISESAAIITRLSEEARLEREKNAKALASALAAKDEAVRAAQEEANNVAMKEQRMWLNIGGGVCMLVFASGAFFGGGIMGFRLTWPFGAIGLLAFGLAQIISQWWFKWACLAVVAVTVAVIVWWAYKHHKQGTLSQELQRKADKANAALRTVVPVLDKAYDDADHTVKDILDNVIFSRLSSKMDRDDKAQIHDIRKELNSSSK